MMTLGTRITVAAVLMAISQLAASQPQTAPPELNVTFAFRAFVNRVSGVGYSASGIPGINPTFVNVASGTEISYLPSVAVRFGRWVASGSFQPSTSYENFISSAAAIAKTERKEWDVSMGYAILPNAVMSIGWKEIDFRTGFPGNPAVSLGALPQKFSGPFVGLAASAPLSDLWALYGTVAYGRAENKVGGVKLGSSNDYVSMELGLQYSLRNFGPSLDRTALIIGYRSQAGRTKNAAVSFLGFNPQTGVPGFQNGLQSSRGTIDGITLGIATSF